MRAIIVPVGLCMLAMVCDPRAKAQSPADVREPAEVVFVCEHGSVKSLVAMEHFNRSARARGLPYRAVARGTAPERAVPEAVQTGLRADGFETAHFVPQRLTASDVEHAALVVSFDHDLGGIGVGKARHLRWDHLPGVLSDYVRGRAAIVTRIDSLVEALARGDRP